MYILRRYFAISLYTEIYYM